MATNPTLPGKFIWFEHVGPDIARARAFYEPLFGWHIEAMPMGDTPYRLINNGDRGIGGLRTAGAGVPSHWISYLSVVDVDASHRVALAAGAKSTFEPMDFGSMGRGAGLLDPTGAAFCLWHSPDGDTPDHEAPVGGWCWNELSTDDPQAALRFYETAFALTHTTMDMGEQGLYHVLNSAGGSGRGGVMKSTMPGAPSMWMPYVRVADCDACVAKARTLGAIEVPLPPMDVPEVGRIAILVDPLGAAVALIDPLPRTG